MAQNTDALPHRPTSVLTCYLTRRRLGAYLDGALGERPARSAAAHVADCGRCQAELDGLRRLRAALRQSAVAVPPDWTGFWAGVVRGIQDRPAAVPARPAWAWLRVLTRPRLAFGGAVAAALVVTLTVWQAYFSPAAPQAALVMSANTEHPEATVMVYSPPERDVAVVWVFGLD